MRRIALIDGLRGYFLVFMLLSHLIFAGGYALVRINHAQLSFVQDAQGFVFLSGLLVGLIYGRRMARDGFASAARPMWRRAFEIYLTMLACIAAVIALGPLLPGSAVAWDPWLGLLADPTPATLTASGLMLYQAAFFDILPQYVLYLAAAPPLVWLCLRGQWLAVVAGSALLWLAVQFGLNLPVIDAVNGLLGTWQPGLALRTVFNPFAWQVLFFTALPIGVLLGARQLDVDRIFDPRRRAPVLVAAAVCLFFLGWRLGFTFDLVPDALTERFRKFEDREEFSFVFLVNFAALGYLLTWVLVAGPAVAARPVRAVSRFLRWLFDLPFLRLLGRHSLQVYAWHAIIVYLVIYIDGRTGPFAEATKTGIAVASVLLLALPPLLIERWGQRRLRAPVSGEAASGS